MVIGDTRGIGWENRPPDIARRILLLVVIQVVPVDLFSAPDGRVRCAGSRGEGRRCRSSTRIRDMPIEGYPEYR